MKHYYYKYIDNGNRTCENTTKADNWKDARKNAYAFMKRHNGVRLVSLKLNY